jgi:CRISPR-associated endoribonuclease Cas6
MRIRLSLMPAAYPALLTTDHHHLASFLYERVGAADAALGRWLHDEGMATPGRADKRYKPLVFGTPACPRYRFAGTEKQFDAGIVHWQIGSPHEEICAALLAGLVSQNRVRIGRTEFVVAEAALIPPPAFAPAMRFITLSPLTAAVNHAELGKVYLREEAALAEAIAANLRWKYLVLTGQETDATAVEVEFDRAYVQARGGFQSRQITRLVRYGSSQIKAYAAPFIVRGDPALLAVGWECGFGEANVQGFGLAGLG